MAPHPRLPLLLLLAAAPPRPAAAAVTVLVNGAAASVRTYLVPSQLTSLVLDTGGAARWTFGGTLLATSVVVNGTELLYGATSASHYVDAAGANGMTVGEVRVLRLTPALAEVALFDTTGSPLRHELHYIARDGVPGLYAYHVLSAVGNASLSEARFITRWSRCRLPYSYTSERGSGGTPTGAYLATQESLQDATWRMAGGNDPALACPGDNSGGYPPNTVYTKYMWSVYHATTPTFGHYGSDAAAGRVQGVFFASLSGISDRTSSASFGGGPLHQDLAVHQDALIANYFHRNHYGSPVEAVTPGWSRLFGPWLTFVVTRRNASDVPGFLAAAEATAAREAAASLPGLGWMNDTRYAAPAVRVTVVGRVVLPVGDTRPPDPLWVLLSPQAGAAQAYDLTDYTYFVRAGRARLVDAVAGVAPAEARAGVGAFALPGVPPGTYSMYVWPAGGAMAGVQRWDARVVVPALAAGAAPPAAAATLDVGAVEYAPAARGAVLLWSVGATDGEGGEFAEGNSTREWEVPERVPGTLTFTVGVSYEPADWYYAQTRGGVWTVEFTLSRAFVGTASLTVAASMTYYDSPAVALNGDATGFTGAVPSGSDASMYRQAVRSAYPRLGVLTFAAARLLPGRNTLTLSRTCCRNGNFSGMGWDALLLEVDEGAAAEAAAAAAGPARLVVTAAGAVSGVAGDPPGATVWAVTVTNAGGAPARLVQLEAAGLVNVTAAATAAAAANGTTTAAVALPPLAFLSGRDPARFALPVAEELPPGGSATLVLRVAGGGAVCAPLAAAGASPAPSSPPVNPAAPPPPGVYLALRVAAGGRRVVTATAVPWACASRSGTPSNSPTPSSSRSATATPSTTPPNTPTMTALPSGVHTFCPALGWALLAADAAAGLGDRCFGALALRAGATSWYAAQTRCAAEVPGGRLATVRSAADAAVVVRGGCGLPANVLSGVAVGLTDIPARSAGANRSCCWNWATPTLGAAAGSVVAGYTYSPADYLRSEEGQALWQGTQPSGGAYAAFCGNLWRTSSGGVPGMDDANCDGTYAYACCEAPALRRPTPSGSATASGTASWSRSPSGTLPPTSAATGTPTASVAPSSTGTGTASGTAAATPTRSPPPTPSGSPTPTGSSTPAPSVTTSPTASATATASPPPTASLTAWPTPTASATGTGSTTSAATASGTGSCAASGTSSESSAATRSSTATGSGSRSRSATRSLTTSSTKSRLASRKASASRTATGSGTRAVSKTRSRSRNASATRSAKSKN